MNKEFLTKMIAAKKLEYEALRELLPEKVNTNIDEINACLKETLLECVMEWYSSAGSRQEKENSTQKWNDSQKGNDSQKWNDSQKENDSQKWNGNQKGNGNQKRNNNQRVQKVTIE